MLKKRYLFLIIICLFAISTVSAADNTGGDIVDVNDSIDVSNSYASADFNDLENDNVANNPNILGICESQNNLSLYDKEDILSELSPPANYYGFYNVTGNVQVDNTTAEHGDNVTISMHLEPCIWDGYYRYDFNLSIYDSNGNKQLTQNFRGKTYDIFLEYSFNSKQLGIGNYTVKMENVKDKVVMTNATLIIENDTVSFIPNTYKYNPPIFSVNVFNTSNIYGFAGSIDMSISPASNSVFVKYYYYLKVYDSNNNEKISHLYLGDSTNYSYSERYTIKPYELRPGKYTLKILNYYNNTEIMSNATLTVLYYPFASNYSVSVNNTELEYDSVGLISMNIFPASSEFTYKYFYYLKVYDSNNNEVISQLYNSTSQNYSKTYHIYPKHLALGNYTIKIINYIDKIVMDTAILTVKYTYPSMYSKFVSVSDTIINSPSGGNITMKISPTISSYYKYYYYLKIYDSRNNEVISQLFNSTNSDYSINYFISPKQLNQGIYTIKLLDYFNMIIDRAKLTVISYPSSSDYSVSVNNTELPYGFGGFISMSISPASGFDYSYFYYLKVYDSTNKEVISHLYNSTSSDYSKNYYINPKQLTPGIYNIRIINYVDNKVMNVANLTVKYTYPSSSDYSVSVNNTNLPYERTGFISMSISPASGFTYKYFYYLKVYDSKNNEVISQLYNGTSSDYSKTYQINYRLALGSYSIKIINHADNKVMDTATLSVLSYPSSSDYSVSVSDTIIYYESDEQISMTISPASGFGYKYFYYFKIYDLNNKQIKSYLFFSNSSDYSRTYNVKSTQLNPGNYTIKIINYNDDTVLDTAKLTVKSSNSSISPNKTITKISASDLTKYYGGSEKFIVTVKEDNKPIIDGKVKININGQTYTKSTDSNGRVSMDVDLNAGTYDANATYKDTSTLAKITINKLTTKIILSSTKNSYNSITLVSSLSPSTASGNVIFTVNSKDYVAKISGSKATYTLSNMADGSYDAKVRYDGDVNHESSISNFVKFTVKEEIKNDISAPNINKYYKSSERFVVTVKENNKPVVGKNVTIVLNDVPYTRTTDSNGQASMAINLGSGKYNVTTEYNGKKVHSTVTVNPTIVAKDFSKIYKNGTQYYAKFTDSNGNLLRNTGVKFNINGVFYTRTTNDQGIARMNINLNPGTYILTAENPSNGEKSATTIKVLPSIITKDLTKYYKNTSKLTFKLLDNQGKPVGAGVSATININGVFYTRTTNASGYVNMNINLNPGTYIATVEYNGLMRSCTVKVLPILSAKDVNMKYKDGTKFGVKLLDGQGKPFAGQKITFNINGVFYDRTTDVNGVARLNINLMSGQYIITSMYSNGAAISNKVTISS